MRLAKKSITNISKKLQNVFRIARINQLAKDVGFIKRQRDLTGYGFAAVNMQSVGSEGFYSLTQQLARLHKDHRISVSKNGFNKRYTPESELFMKRLFEEVTQLKFGQVMDLSLFNRFAGVEVRDATQLSLPEVFSDLHKGSGGSASSASLKLDLRYDLTSTDLAIEQRAGVSSDSSASVTEVVKNRLYLQDLGYFKFANYQYISDLGGYFITRYKYNTNIYVRADSDTKSSISDLTKGMKIGEVRSRTVYLGAKARLKVRLIMERLPKKVADKKRAKLIKKASKSGQKVSKERLAACDYTLLISNIMDDALLTAKQIIFAYKIRWQIEIMFKCWKSVMQLGEVHPMNPHRFQTMLYGHLIWIVLCMKITSGMKSIIWNNYKVELSELKVFKILSVYQADFMRLWTQAHSSAGQLRSLQKLLGNMLEAVFLYAEKECRKNVPNPLFHPSDT